MKKLLVLLTILSSIMAYAEDTIELDQTTVKGSKTSDYTAPPKEQKNTFVITQERIREKNYKNVEDILRDAPGVVVQNTAFGPRIDMRGSGEKSLSRVKVLVDGISINPTEETMASLPINAIPVESIKKIEIIPGGGATLYGSGSVGGVVSISTNSNVTRDNFFMDLNYGSYDNRNFGFAGRFSHITQEKIFYDVKSEMQAKFEEDKKGLKVKAKFDYNLIENVPSETILGYDYQTSINKRKSLVQSETLKNYYDSSIGGFRDLDSADRSSIIKAKRTLKISEPSLFC